MHRTGQVTSLAARMLPYGSRADHFKSKHRRGEPGMINATWCYTCGNPVENGKCACWCHIADALQRFAGRDFDSSADEASRMWDALDDSDKAYVWSAQYAADHDVPVYPPAETAELAAQREQDRSNYPHDEDCPRCGRRQWGLNAADPMNPTDAEQETCAACGYHHE